MLAVRACCSFRLLKYVCSWPVISAVACATLEWSIEVASYSVGGLFHIFPDCLSLAVYASNNETLNTKYTEPHVQHLSQVESGFGSHVGLCCRIIVTDAFKYGTPLVIA